MAMLGRVDGRITWTALSQLRTSIVGKALTTISVVSLVLGNATDTLEKLGISTTSAHVTFWGSIVFVLGYIAYSALDPGRVLKGRKR